MLFYSFNQTFRAGIEKTSGSSRGKGKDRTAELKQRNELLHTEIMERKRTEEEKENILHDLNERVKELGLLYSLSELVMTPGISLEGILRKMVHLILPAWQYPNVACARIIFKDQIFKTDNFQATRWKQSADIKIDEEKAGIVEVYYLEEEPELDEGPFLKEERDLIEAIAERLGKIAKWIQAESRQKLLTQILETLNQPSKKIDQIRNILLLIKEFSGFEAVGVRLREGEDFPYYETRGLPSDFVEAESYLCARDQAGELIRDSTGNPVLECMCGNVICGRTDPSLPFFTEIGSFWTNSTTELLASTTEEDRQARTRNRCNGEGYESVALIPLRSDKKIIGLLQLNDSRKNKLTLEMIDFWEKVGASIGIALERKSTEESLELAHRELTARAAQLEAANSELSEYAYAVSHDVRAPLRAIHNYADLLIEDLESGLFDEQKKYLNGLCSAAREAENLVEDLLELTQIGRRTGPIDSIDIGMFLKNLLDSLHLPEEVQIVMGDDWPVLEAETILLRQIFQNLIDNALKFNSYPAKRVEIGWRSVEEKIYEFFVRDNGIGIDPRFHEKIFQIFERLHTKEEYEGTGIGLAIVKKATAILQGSISVESKPAEGSTFFVTLPARQEGK